MTPKLPDPAGSIPNYLEQSRRRWQIDLKMQNGWRSIMGALIKVLLGLVLIVVLGFILLGYRPEFWSSDVLGRPSSAPLGRRRSTPSKARERAAALGKKAANAAETVRDSDQRDRTHGQDQSQDGARRHGESDWRST